MLSERAFGSMSVHGWLLDVPPPPAPARRLSYGSPGLSYGFSRTLNTGAQAATPQPDPLPPQQGEPGRR